MYKLVLIRHGESTWNLENRFTGWTDVELTPLGVSQARAARAAEQLRKAGYEKAVSVAGGTAAWREASLPIEKTS